MINSKHFWPVASAYGGTLRPGTTWLPLLRRAAAGLRDAWRARRERVQAGRVLSEYRDWELRDLGLSRCDIARIADGTFQRN